MPVDLAPLLLTGGVLFDDDRRTFASNMEILCHGGRIAAVAPAGHIPRTGADVLDCGGAYLIPGMIDCHVHITSSGEAAALNDARTEPGPLRAWKAADHARRTLAAGFTTVRDLGASEQLNIHLAKAIDDGIVPGPTVLAAGLGVTMTGGHGHGFIAREADGADDVRKAVREQLRAGANAVKLFASGGVLTPGVDPRSPSFTLEELTAGVEEAHKAFRVVAAHAQATQAIKNAVAAGVDSIEHGVWLDEEAIAMMADRGTYLVATLTAPQVMVAGGESAGLRSYMVEKSRQVYEAHTASFKAAARAGVRLAMGTDQGTPLNRPGENAQEIIRMRECGLSPAAALLAATAWAADLLQVPAGRLREGKRADIVALPADPLGDLTVLTRPAGFRAILKAGRPVQLSKTEPGVQA